MGALPTTSCHRPLILIVDVIESDALNVRRVMASIPSRSDGGPTVGLVGGADGGKIWRSNYLAGRKIGERYYREERSVKDMAGRKIGERYGGK